MIGYHRCPMAGAPARFGDGIGNWPVGGECGGGDSKKISFDATSSGVLLKTQGL